MSKPSRFFIAGALFASLLAPVIAQEVVTLREAVTLAVQRDVRVLGAQARETTAAREADLAAARFGPNLFAGTGAAYTHGFPRTPAGAPPSVFNVDFTQTLFDGPARGRARAARQRLEAFKGETSRSRDEVMLDTALTYFELSTVRQAIERQRVGRTAAGQLLDITRERLDAGRTLPLDLLDARLQAARLDQRLIELQGRESELEERLHLATGLPAGRIVVTAQTLPSLPERPLDDLIARAHAESPDAAAARVERQAREELLSGVRRAAWPVVDLVGQYALLSRFNNVDVFYNRFQATSVNVGFSVRLPLFSAETSAATALARAQVQDADAAMRRSAEQIALEVRRAAQTARESAAARDVAELELALAQEASRVTTARAEEGKASGGDSAKSLLDEARAWDGFLRADFERTRAQLQLRRLTGELRTLFP